MPEAKCPPLLEAIGHRARAAAAVVANASTECKNHALTAIAAVLEEQREAILAANVKDLNDARAAGLNTALLDRLELNEERVQEMAKGLHDIAALPDCIGAVSDLQRRPSGIEVGKMRVPLGVVAIVYESRPSVTIDAAALCLKSGNASILRGGSEAWHSNQALAACVAAGLQAAQLPEAVVQVLDKTERSMVVDLARMDQWIDVIIPRGGPGLIASIIDHARMPVMKHLSGVCHTYVDRHVDVSQAITVAYNAKVQRFGTCNTMETLLLHEEIAPTVLPDLARQYAEAGVELRGCSRSQQLVAAMLPATEEDWSTEYLAPVLAVKVVASLDEAIAHIDRYGSGHTEAILSNDYRAVRHFLRAVDAASVLANASTRLADGHEYGLGAEIGTSTDKFHARGPVGLEGLTTQKYVVFGDGHIRT